MLFLTKIRRSVAERCQAWLTCRLLPVVIFAAMIPLFSGCKLLPGQDPLLVRAEQSVRFAYAATDSFVKFEYDNRMQYPQLKPLADKIRMYAPMALASAREATKAYKASKTALNADVLVQHLAVVESLTREAQAGTVSITQ
jgi:hypothetical protein